MSINKNDQNYIDGVNACKDAIVDLIWKQMETDDSTNLVRLARLIEQFDVNDV